MAFLHLFVTGLMYILQSVTDRETTGPRKTESARQRMLRITTFKKHLLREAIHKNLINNTLSEVKFQQRTQAPSNETKQKTNLALHNTIPPSSFKSQINLNEEVVSNTATTIAKSNLQGTAHNIIQKEALT